MRIGIGLGMTRRGSVDRYAAFAFAFDPVNGFYKPTTTNLVTGLPGYSYTRSGAKGELKAGGYGPELLVNGGFDSDTVWAKGTGWTISGGSASHAASGGSDNLNQNAILVVGKTYEVVVDATVTAGLLAVYLGLGGFAGNVSASGRFVFTAVASVNTNFYLQANPTFAGSVQTVSVREVIPVIPSVTYGPELIPAGQETFDSATGWVAGAAWTVSGGVATASALTSGINRSDLGVTTGKTYEISFDLIGSGSVAPFSKGTLGTIQSGAGRKTVQIVAGSGFSHVDFWATILPVAIDNISVREVITDSIDDFAANVPGIVPGVGYWARPSVTNVVQYSQALDNAIHTKNDLTVTSDAIMAPDGTLTADALVETVTTASHNLSLIQSAITPYVAGSTYTMSAFLKAGTRTFAQLTFNAGSHGSAQYANFNLSNGTVAFSTGGTASIVDCGNGWYRCIWTATATISVSTTGGTVVIITNGAAGRGESYLGSATNLIYAWQAQNVAGTQPGPIIVTTGAVVTVGVDDLRFNQSALNGTEQDFIFYAKVDFPNATSATNEVLAYIGDVAATHYLYLYRTVAGKLTAIAAAGGPTLDVGVFPDVTHGTGTAIVLVRRKAGKFSIGVRSGVSSSMGTEGAATAFPNFAIAGIQVGSLNGGQNMRGVAKLVGLRKGTFSDAQCLAILGAA